MFENLTNADVLILGGLIGVIIAIGVICIILTIKGGKTKVSKETEKEEKSVSPEPDIHIALATENIPAIDNIKEIDKTVDIITEPEQTEEITVYDEPVMIDCDPVGDQITEASNYEPKYVQSYEPFYDDEEVLSVNSKLEEAQDAKNGASIEEVLKAMQVDLEKQKYETIDRYEEEQEENAVISYQELLNRKMALSNEEVPKKQVEIEEEKASSSYLDELPNFKDIVLEPIPDRNEERPFMNSEFVSPIFGRLSSNVEYPTVKKTSVTEELIKTEVISAANTDKLDDNDEFLNTLKEFRRNL